MTPQNKGFKKIAQTPAPCPAVPPWAGEGITPKPKGQPGLVVWTLNPRRAGLGEGVGGGMIGCRSVKKYHH